MTTSSDALNTTTVDGGIKESRQESMESTRNHQNQQGINGIKQNLKAELGRNQWNQPGIK